MPGIVLIGFMGCGKTSVGSLLAERLAIPFFDSDQLIESKEQKQIKTIFEEYGETYFRDLEREIISEFKKPLDFVLATGGGLPCHNNTMEVLNQIGITVFLETSAKELYHRLILEKKNRPLLNTREDEPFKLRIESLLEERIPFYSKSKFTLNTDGRTLEDLVGSLIEVLSLRD
jgi:shikimate kinase